MKNKKMMAIAALALAGMLTLTGCGANGNAAKSAAKPQASEQKADDKGGAVSYTHLTLPTILLV